jgi:hypothetical protein
MSRSCIAQGDAMPPEWINLYLAPAMLNLMDDGRLRGAFGNVEAAIASAVQSGVCLRAAWQAPPSRSKGSTGG